MGTPASRNVVRKLLKKSHLGQRKASKKKSMGAHPDRNAQFENIACLKALYLQQGAPVISQDTNKKELIGNFSREGTTFTQVQVQTLDHDFPSAGVGKLIPHGLYDLARNTSVDTSEFCCDSIPHWWAQHGRQHYPQRAPPFAAVRWRRCKSWPSSLGWKSAWPIVRRTAPSTTR